MHLHTSQSGFSLIELLVSLTIFSVVVTMTAGTLLVLIDANAKAQNIQAVVNNVTFALDSIARELRTGYAFNCSNQANAPSGVDGNNARNDCSNANYISVRETGGSLTRFLGSDRIAYYYDNDYPDGSGHGAILRKLGNDTSGNENGWYPLTSKNVDISNVRFTVTGSSLSDNLQPTVTIFIEGEAGDFDSVDSKFSMQTTITQRLLDF